jgi:RND family efflux transporter MFP subunit
MLAAPGTPIAVLEQSGGYRLEAAVEESRLGNVRPGMRAEVRLDAFDRSLSGVVSEIVPALDPASRTFAVKIDLPGGLPLRSGLFGRARFALGEQSALLVPAAAVQTEGQLRKVYVVDGGVARARLVTLGSGHEAGFEVLSGLSEGEAVVTPLPAALTDGGRVEVRP